MNCDTVTKKQYEENLRKSFEEKLPNIIDKFCSAKPNGIQPNTHFAPVFAECILLYVYGYYYGAISLTQSVAEALAKFLCERNDLRLNRKSNFSKNIEKLIKAKKITKKIHESFLSIWEHRNDYHHLNPEIEKDKQYLEVLAKEKLEQLISIEKEIFSYSRNNRKLIPKYPKYWDIENGQLPVYLDLI